MSQNYDVSGRVLDAEGQPQASLSVKVFHKADLSTGGDTQKGTTATTGSDGSYQVTWTEDPPASLDLYVVAESATVEVARSNIQCAAPVTSVVDLVLEGSEYVGRTEFDRVKDNLDSFFSPIQPKDADPTDIEWLACKADTHPVWVAQRIQAARLADGRAVPEKAFYGMMRMGLPADLEGMLRAGSQAQRSALKQAFDRRVIPADSPDSPDSVDAEIDAIISDLQTLVLDSAIRNPSAGEKSLKEILDTVPGVAGPEYSVSDQREFLQLWLDNEGDAGAFWTAVRSSPTFGSADADTLQFTLQAATATRRFLPALQELQDRRDAAQITSMKDLAAYSLADWENFVATTGAPTDLPGATQQDREDFYAVVLRRVIEDGYPTEVFARCLENESPPPPYTEEVVQFLDDNPGFDLSSTILARYLEENANALDNINDHDRLKANIRRIQRLHNMAGRFGKCEITFRLLENEIGSAFDVQSIGREAFVAKFTSILDNIEGKAGVDHAECIYEIASVKHSASFMMMQQFGQAFAKTNTNVISQHVAEIGSEEGLADLETLFGTLDYCSCKHCRSVYSPAAYLVDMLAWLKNRDAGGGQSGLDLLLARRPDLQHLELSCENTNTGMPYIDLVNETLEDAIAPPNPAVWRQTTLETDQLVVNPEHVNDDAYTPLANTAVFPWGLPFDRWSVEARVYMSQLGVARRHLMKVLQDDGSPISPDSEDIVADALGLNRFAHDIITGDHTQGTDAREFWGFAPGAGTWVTTLRDDIELLLERSELSLPELEELVGFSFVDPAAAIAVTFNPSDDCALANASLTGTVQELTDAFERMHRFMRLQRATGMRMRDLDAFVVDVATSTLDSSALGKLVTARDLLEMISTEPRDLPSLWANLNTRKYDDGELCLYDRLFQNPAIKNPPDTAFALNVGRTELETTGTIDATNKATILAGLRVTEDELDQLIASSYATNALDLANLSKLWRHAELARETGLRVSELIALRDITGDDPFSSPDASLDFVELVKGINRTKFSVAQLDYLTRHEFSAIEAIAPDDEATATRFTDLVTEIRAVNEEIGDLVVNQGSLVDTDGTLTRKYLGLVIVKDEDLDEAMAIVGNRSQETDPTQEAFIDAHFGSFTNTATAKTNLVGGGEMLNVQDRFEWVLGELLVHAKKERHEGLLVTAMADEFGVDDATARKIVFELIENPANSAESARDVFLDSSLIGQDLEANPINRANNSNLFDAFGRCHKTAMIVDGFGIETDDLDWYFEHAPPKVTWVTVNSLPLSAQATGNTVFAEWDSLRKQRELTDSFQGAGNVHADIIGAADLGSAMDVLTERTQWKNEDLDYLVGASGFVLTHVDDFRNADALIRIRDAMLEIRRLGVSASKAWSWAHDAPSESQAAEIRQAVKGKYDDRTWTDVGRQLRDSLREMQRDALLAHLIHTTSAYNNVDDVYSDLLLDVQMSSCMLTSRLKLALSSVQMFINRVFLNLESSTIEFNDSARREWAWMKNYRVWEANRKVFLYPENWVEPSLRDDKTPLYEDLENFLRQGEITDGRVEQAYEDYLRGLQGISHLEVVGLYHDFDPDDASNSTDTVHVFARTKNDPSQYFYRRRIDDSYWTPWEEVPLDIDTPKVAPVIYNNRLFLFWASLVENPKKQSSETPKDPIVRYQVKLSWSEYRNGKWSPKKVTRASSRMTDKENVYPAIHKTISIRAYPGGFGEWKTATLYVDAHYDLRDDEGNSQGAGMVFANFRYNVCTDSMEDRSHNVADDENVYANADLGRASDGVRPEHQRLRFSNSLGTLDLLERDPNTQLPSAMPVLGQIPNWGCAVVPAHHYRRVDTRAALFHDDWKYAFYVRPEAIALEVANIDDGETISPASVDAADWDTVWGCIPSSALPDDESDDGERPGNFGAALDGVVRPTLWNGTLPGHSAIEITSGAPPQESSIPDANANIELQIKKVHDTAIAISSSAIQTAAIDKHSPIPWYGQLWRYHQFSHPYSCFFLKEFSKDGFEGLLAPKSGGLKRQLLSDDYFAARYEPIRVKTPYPVRDVDFEYGGAFTTYNWELFFHIPLMVAEKLSEEGRHEDAQRWFHYVFNPLDASSSSTPARYWNIKPFYEHALEAPKNFLRVVLGYDGTEEQQKAARKEFFDQVNASRQNPFNPHLLARLRKGTYERTTVMKYLDNLIAWGDALFRRDTIESLNEATQIYVIAAAILGDRPVEIVRDDPAPKTFNDISGSLDAFSNALVDLENFPLATKFYKPTKDRFSLSSHSVDEPPVGVKTHYFCIPPNDKLLDYWDTVADRLFKIRHCLNIEGVRRQLPLFEPPIDPALLVRATAAGLDISSVLSGLDGGLTPHRYRVVYQRAVDFCADVRNIGSLMLQALEKRDGEQLALLRSEHEVALLDRVRDVREQQIKEARENLEGLKKSRRTVEARRDYYRSRGYMNERESDQIKKLDKAHSLQDPAGLLDTIAGFVGLLPSISVGVPSGVSLETGGPAIAAALRASAGALNYKASKATFAANKAQIMGGYDRRLDDWRFQGNQAEAELAAIDKQIVAAEIRVAIAELELRNHERQVENAKTVDAFMRDKYTNDELYDWMVSQVAGLYYQSYRLAYDMAKKAERAYRFELGIESTDYIQFGYWDSLKKGLLAGERLNLDLKRLDAGYIENNRRELELTKNVSLRMLDPEALLELRETGSCEIEIPEVLFDLDHPGHYMRRIKSVSLTIPAVTGPNTTLGAKLFLLNDRVRVNTDISGDYLETAPDSRFRYRWGAIDAIATSTAQSDGGVFQLDFRDDRYLPFEGAGAIGKWRLELPDPAGLPQFDYDTISDVVMQVSYTAREGGEVFRTVANGVEAKLLSAINAVEGGAGFMHMFSMKQDFPTEWNQFLYPPESQEGQSTSVDVGLERYPYLVRNKTVSAVTIQAIMLVEDSVNWQAEELKIHIDPDSSASTEFGLKKDGQYGPSPYSSKTPNPSWSPESWTISAVETEIVGTPVHLDTGTHDRIDPSKVKDLLIIVHYQVS